MMGSKYYQDEYRAVNWRTDDGLAHNKIYCMLKDVNGFLWIGTEGAIPRGPWGPSPLGFRFPKAVS